MVSPALRASFPPLSGSKRFFYSCLTPGFVWCALSYLLLIPLGRPLAGFFRHE
jgi:hypothetical protein